MRFIKTVHWGRVAVQPGQSASPLRGWKAHSDSQWVIDLPESLESFKQLRRWHVPLAGTSGTNTFAFFWPDQSRLVIRKALHDSG